MRFEFATATRILFGPGTISEAGLLAKEFGARALVVTGRPPTRSHPLVETLRAQSISAITFAVGKEPELQTVQTGVALARQEGCELVIGFGGGSALDAAKAIAAMLTNVGEVLDYLEVIGR